MIPETQNLRVGESIDLAKDNELSMELVENVTEESYPEYIQVESDCNGDEEV